MMPQPYYRNWQLSSQTAHPTPPLPLQASQTSQASQLSQLSQADESAADLDMEGGQDTTGVGWQYDNHTHLPTQHDNHLPTHHDQHLPIQHDNHLLTQQSQTQHGEPTPDPASTTSGHQFPVWDPRATQPPNPFQQLTTSSHPFHQTTTPHFPIHQTLPPNWPATPSPNTTTPPLPLVSLPPHNGTTLIVEAVEPSPDIHLADDPAMSLHNQRDANQGLPNQNPSAVNPTQGLPNQNSQAPPNQSLLSQGLHLLNGGVEDVPFTGIPIAPIGTLPPVLQTHFNREQPGEDDDEDSADDDDEDGHEHGHGQAPPDNQTTQFYLNFKEDMTVPSEEEQRIIDASEEHSAHDHAYWCTKTFFPTKDPEILPGEEAILEWTINNFNGTRENPRKELLIRSPSARIGDFEWRIKLLPRGHLSTDRVSAYVECLSMQDDTLYTEWPEDQLTPPKIGENKVLKRKSVTAQVSILLYNPDEPRVNEFHTDAHQFHPGSPDHGWSRFTAMPWYDMHRRIYAARQPLLRKDRIAVKAFIRIIHDPTRCLWPPKSPAQAPDPVATIGLQDLPSFDGHCIQPVLSLLLHLRPFRTILYHLGKNPPAEEPPAILPLFQALLYRMRSRDTQPPASMTSEYVHDYVGYCYEQDRESHDVMQMMNNMVGDVQTQLEALAAKNDRLGRAAQLSLQCFKELFGDPDMQFSSKRRNKLSIMNKSTMQQVVDGGTGMIDRLGTPQLLTIELERQTFDPKKRNWVKILNKVKLDDEISVNGENYVLYGFVTHTGYLQNGKFASFFRPNGLGNLWYTYKASENHKYQPRCMTKKQAVSPREGSRSNASLEESAAFHDRSAGFPSFGGPSGEQQPVAYIVLYIRQDVAMETFYMSSTEPWNVPRLILCDYVEAMSDESDQEEYGVPDLSTTPGAANALTDSDVGSPDILQDEDYDMNDDASDRIPPPSSQQVAHSAASGDLVETTINYFSRPRFVGTTLNNTYHGLGQLISLNGDQYTGNFSHGLRDGDGHMMYANGDIYNGEWKANEHHGRGTYTEARTGNVYEGNFEAGKKCGEGVTRWKMSEEQARLCQICYSADVDTAFYDCGHVVCCGTCAKRVETCPACRRRIRDVLKLFYTA